MAATPPVSTPSAGQLLAQAYDQQQRLRLTRSIALLLLGTSLVVAVTTLAIHQTQAVAVSIVSVIASVAFGIGYWLANTQRARWAAVMVTATALAEGCMLALFISTLFAGTPANAFLGFIALVLGIIVASLLGTRWWIVTATAVLNVFTVVAALLILPHMIPSPLLAPAPLLVVALGSQWLCAVLLGFNQMRYQQMLRSFSETQTAYAQAQQLDDLKDQFISSVNHELRNPVMAMMNYVTILRQRHDTMTADKRAEYLTSLDETGRRVIQLIGSILDIRQLAQHPEEFDPAMVGVKDALLTASQLLDPAEARMAERDLIMHIPDDVTIWGNGIYLQQIFTNLLSNAMKYSSPGTPIEVKAHAVVSSHEALGRRKPERSMVEITVSDHGLGIPPDQASLLFNRFVRLSRDLTSRISGNGLGLYLCKVLTEAMGGRIWLESSGIEGEGTTFHLVLPAEPEAVQPVTASSQAVLRVPVRQARLVFAAAMALFVVISGILIVNQRPAPPGISMVDSVHFFDTAQGPFNGVDMSISGLSAPANGAHYQAWIINATDDRYFSLGNLVLQDATYVLHYPGSSTNQNLLGVGDEIEITIERAQSPVPVGKAVLVGFFPPEAIIHLRHLLVSFPVTPGNKGLLVGLMQQAQLLARQAQQLQATGAHNPTLSHCLILSQLNILEGNSGSAKQPLSSACQRLHVTGGDGYGMLSLANIPGNGYINGAVAHAALTIQQPDATGAMHIHGPRVTASLAQVQTQAMALDRQLHQLSSHFDAAQLPEITAAAQRMLTGNADGTTPPPPGPGGPPNTGAPPSPDSVFAAYHEAQLMADFTFTSSR